MVLTENGKPLTPTPSTPTYETWLDHLETDEMGQPAKLRLLSARNNVLIPTYAIERLLKDGYDAAKSDISLAFSIESSRREVAFDAETLPLTEIINDIHTLIDQYNQPPEDLSPWEKVVWLQETVIIDTIEAPTHESLHDLHY
jgi:hypothetical protein